MTDTDLKFHAEFRALEAELARLVAPPGMGTARAVARRRRAVKRAVLACASVLPLVAGVLLVAVGWHQPGQRLGGAATPATPQFGPVLDRREIGYCPPPAAAAPEGAVTPDEICSGTIDVPAWPERYPDCPAGPVPFSYGAYDTDGPLPAGIVPSTVNVATHYMTASVLVTVGETSTQLYHDAMPVAFTSRLADGTVDTIVQVNCEFNNAVAPASMVLALRPGPRGAIETVGTVVAGQGPSIKCLYGLGASGDEVRVLVGDACNEGASRPAQLQWRSYRLVDGAFIQAGGPTSFTFNPAGGPESHGQAWTRWADPALQAGLVGSPPQAGFDINHSR